MAAGNEQVMVMDPNGLSVKVGADKAAKAVLIRLTYHPAFTPSGTTAL